MARYLVVAHRTAESHELADELRRLAADDPAAEFVLLVPSTPSRPLVSEVREDLRRARARTKRAAVRVRSLGLRVAGACAVEGDLVDAIRDRWDSDGPFARIVISTLPRGLSAWLRVDGVSRARRQFGRRVIHVVAQPAAPVRERLVAAPRVA